MLDTPVKIQSKPHLFFPTSRVSALHPPHAAAIGEAFRLRWPELAKSCGARVAEAVDIVSNVGACRDGDLPGTYLVQASTPHTWWLVDMRAKSCSCPDHRAHGKEIICKHRLAIGFHLFGPDWLRENSAVRIHLENVTEDARYRIFKEMYPDSGNITAATLHDYFRVGTVEYNHPLQGKFTVQVVAGLPYSFGNTEVVDVVAFRLAPFADGVGPADHTRILASKFIPANK